MESVFKKLRPRVASKIHEDFNELSPALLLQCEKSLEDKMQAIKLELIERRDKPFASNE